MDAKLRDRLREIFNKHDPIGIYRGKETNYDEYDPEIDGLLIRFNRSENVDEFIDEVHIVFKNMFGKEITGPKKKYKKLASDLYEFLKKN